MCCSHARGVKGVKSEKGEKDGDGAEAVSPSPGSSQSAEMSDLADATAPVGRNRLTTPALDTTQALAMLYGVDYPTATELHIKRLFHFSRANGIEALALTPTLSRRERGQLQKRWGRPAVSRKAWARLLGGRAGLAGAGLAGAGFAASGLAGAGLTGGSPAASTPLSTSR